MGMGFWFFAILGRYSDKGVLTLAYKVVSNLTCVIYQRFFLDIPFVTL